MKIITDKLDEEEPTIKLEKDRLSHGVVNVMIDGEEIATFYDKGVMFIHGNYAFTESGNKITWNRK